MPDLVAHAAWVLLITFALSFVYEFYRTPAPVTRKGKPSSLMWTLPSEDPYLYVIPIGCGSLAGRWSGVALWVW
jgi:hypothetical protein